MIKKDIIPTRAVIGVMIFTACLISYMLRVNMSINLIAMVEPTTALDGSSGITSECAMDDVYDGNSSYPEAHQLTAPPDYGQRYDWNSKTQGLILGSYFWGYIVSSMPGGFLAERFGPAKIVTFTTLVSAVLTMLTPLAATWHYAVIVTFRVILGVLGGVVYPCLHCLISRWAPPEEKGKFTGALLGGTLGTVLTWPLLGMIIERLGWSAAFFIPGGLSFVWCVLWHFLVSDRPESHPRISDDEKFHIVKSLGNSVKANKSVPPYGRMFVSVPFWALTILHFGNLWGLYLLLTSGPKYMSEVLGFNLGHSGILASLPYLARMISGFAFGFIGDHLRSNGRTSITCIRKSFVTFSHIVPGVFLIAQTLVGCNATLAVTFMTLALGMNGASTLTNLQNSQDLAPNFAGTIYGIINCIGGTTGFITPMLTGYITSEHNGLEEWQVIFWIGAAIYIGCGLIYCVFGSGDMQPWNEIKSETISEETPEGVSNEAYVAHPEGITEITKV